MPGKNVGEIVFSASEDNPVWKILNSNPISQRVDLAIQAGTQSIPGKQRQVIIVLEFRAAHITFKFLVAERLAISFHRHHVVGPVTGEETLQYYPAAGIAAGQPGQKAIGKIRRAKTPIG